MSLSHITKVALHIHGTAGSLEIGTNRLRQLIVNQKIQSHRSQTERRIQSSINRRRSVRTVRELHRVHTGTLGRNLN